MMRFSLSRTLPDAEVGQGVSLPRRVAKTGAFGALWLSSIILPFTAFGVAAALIWSDVEADVRARLGRTVDMLHEHALRAFEAQDLALISTRALMRDRDWSEIAASNSLHTALVELDWATPSTAGVALIAPDGQLAAASRLALPTPGVNLSGRDYVQIHRRADPTAPTTSAPITSAGIFVGEVTPGATTGWPVFRLSRARVDAQGNTDGGVISAAFFPSYFADFWRSVAESEKDIVLLVRHDGAILAHHPPPPEPVGLRLARTRLLEAMATAPPGGGKLLRVEIGPAAEQRLVAFRRLNDFPVSVAYAIDPSVQHADWLRRLLAPALGAAASAALLLLLTARAQVAAASSQQAAEQRARLEAQLRRSEAGAAIGHLAAGIAHDFSNVAQVVASGARIIEAHAEEPVKVRKSAVLMAGTAERAARMAARMLAFARRSGAMAETGAKTEPLDLTTTLAEVADLLGETLGAGIEVQYATARPAPPRISVERAELESTIINLCVNARDAMPRGGSISIEAGGDAVALGEEHPDQLGIGAYARIAVCDTGSGMDAATLGKVGEAFFTTKPPGRGTGLGLSMARGFAIRAGGAMRIESEPGKGTTVVLWLPAHVPTLARAEVARP
jgi:signal transduction histidine kinase